MAKPCWSNLAKEQPELHRYLSSKVDFNPETEEGKADLIKAARDLQEHARNTIHDIYARVGVGGYTRREPVVALQQKPDEISVSEVLGKPVTYKGQPATLEQDGQTVIAKLKNEPKEFELGNIDEVKNHPISEYGITHESSVVSVSDNGKVVVRGEEFTNNFSKPLEAISRDKEGNYSVSLENSKGQKRTFRGNVAEDIAYQLHLKEHQKDNETRQATEQHINTEPAVTAEINNAGLAEAAPQEATGNNAEPVPREKAERVVSPPVETKPVEVKPAEPKPADTEQLTEAEKKVKGKVAGVFGKKSEKFQLNISPATFAGESPIKAKMEAALAAFHDKDYDKANRIYNEILDEGEKVLNASIAKIDGVTIKIERSKGNYFGEEEPTFIAELSIADNTKMQDAFNAIADFADEFHQRTVHVSKVFDELPEGGQLGKENPDGSTYEPDIELRFKNQLSDKEFDELSQAIQGIGKEEGDTLAGATLHPDKKGLTLYNISKLKDHEDFIKQAEQIGAVLQSRGVEATYKQVVRQLWDYGEPKDGGRLTFEQLRQGYLPNKIPAEKIGGEVKFSIRDKGNPEHGGVKFSVGGGKNQSVKALEESGKLGSMQDKIWQQNPEDINNAARAASDRLKGNDTDENGRLFDEAMARSREFNKSVRAAYSAGNISDEDIKKYKNADIGDLKPIGDKEVYHLSVSADKVEENGFLTKDELLKKGGKEGIGGGRGGISLTYDKKYAETLYRIFNEIKDALNGKVDIADEFKKLGSKAQESIIRGMRSALGGEAKDIREAIENNRTTYQRQTIDSFKGFGTEKIEPASFIKHYYNALSLFSDLGDREWIALHTGVEKLKNADIGIFKAKTKPNAHGEILPAEREYHVFSGDAVENLERITPKPEYSMRDKGNPELERRAQLVKEYMDEGVKTSLGAIQDSIAHLTGDNSPELKQQVKEAYDYYNERYIPKEVHAGIVSKIFGKAVGAVVKVYKNQKELLRSAKQYDKAPKFQITGEKANHEKEVKDNLGTAKEMETAGKDAAAIHAATGWIKGADGKWKYDSVDELKLDTSTFDKDEKGVLLSVPRTAKNLDEAPALVEIVKGGKDSKLFKEYPQLKKIKASIQISKDIKSEDETASYNRGNKSILVLANSEKTANEMLTHELQHAVQHIEGFGQGGTLMSILDKGNYKDKAKLIILANKLEDAQEQGDEKLVGQIMDKLYDQHYDFYHRISGEVEARNAAERAKTYTPEERRRTPITQTQDTPSEQQHVVFMRNPKGEVLGFKAPDGTIHLNGEKINGNTPVHEAGHLWLEWAEKERPDLHKRGMDLTADSQYLKDVKANQDYIKQADEQKLKGKKREAFFRNEALATAIGDKGEEFVSKARKADFKSWLKNLWEGIKEHFGIRNMSADEVSKLTLDEFSKKVAADILSGEPFGKEGDIKEPPPPPKEKGGASPTSDKTVLSFKGLQEVADDFNLENIHSRTPVSDRETMAMARDTITQWVKDGSYVKNVQDLVDTAEQKLPVSDVQRLILEQHLANLRQAVNDAIDTHGLQSNEYDKTLQELQRVNRAGMFTRSAAGATLRIGGEMGSIVRYDVPDMMARTMDALDVDTLTDTQKQDIADKAKEIKEKLKTAEAKLKAYEGVIAKYKAQAEIDKAAKKARTYLPSKGTTKKTHEEFVTERKSLVEKLKQQLADYRAAGQKLGVTADGGAESFVITAKMAKTIGQIVASHVEELGSKLKEVAERTLEDIKDFLPHATIDDVHDVIAGKYNVKQKTKNQLQRDLEDIHIQQNLIEKLQSLEKGIVPKNPKKEIQRNQEITKLRKQIKDHPVKKLAEIKAANEARAAKIRERIAKKDFTTPEKQTSFLDDKAMRTKFPKEFKAAMDAIIAKEDAQHDFEAEVYKEELRKRNLGKKTVDFIGGLLGTVKAIRAGFDVSAIGIQNIVPIVAHPIRNFPSLVKSFKAFSEGDFRRDLAALHNSPNWELIKKSGLDVTDPKSLSAQNKEDIYSNNMLEKDFTIAGKKYNIGKYTSAPFERQFVSLGNHIRVNLFLRLADKLQRQGKTFENNEHEFKAIARLANTQTGRGGLPKFMKVATKEINSVVWSSHLIASRLNLLGVGDIGLALAGKKGFYRSLGEKGKVISLAQKVAAYDMVRFIGGVAGVYLLASYAFGAKADLDPQSVTFGNLEDPDTKKSYNLFGGFSQYVRLAAMEFTGARKFGSKYEDISDDKGTTRGDILTRFARGKTTPAASEIIDFLYKKDFLGSPVNPVTEAESMVIPLAQSDVLKNMQRDDLGQFFFEWALGLTGVNITDERDLKHRK